MKRLIASTLLAATLVTSADAFTVRGIGGMPCTEWNNGKDWNTKVQYALGFISGAESIILPKITTGTGNIENNSIIQAVTAWCKQNPREEIADALMAAVHSMQN